MNDTHQEQHGRDRHAMEIRVRRDLEVVELSPLAAGYFESGTTVAIRHFGRLGPTLGADGQARLGQHLIDRLQRPPADGVPEYLAAGAGALIASYHGDSCTLYAVTAPTAGDGATAERERRHALRNQINTINMNAELIALLATQAGEARIGECAARVAEACRQAAAALDP